MNGAPLALGLAGLLAGASALQRRGSRDALRPTPETALIVAEQDNGLPCILLVDAALASKMKTEAELEACEACVLGFIRLSYPHDARERITVDCDGKDGTGPLEVYNAVARKGWGPLTYDAALWIASDMQEQGDQFNGYLVPDRNNVSAAARNVWRYYAEKRKADVTSRKIPSTCPTHGYPDPDPFLDRMYKAKNDAPAFQAMLSVYGRGRDLVDHLESTLSAPSRRGNLDRTEIEQIFLELGEKLFGRYF